MLTAGAAVLLCLVACLSLTAVAAPPAQLTSQAPGYYRTMVGDMEVVALYDGHFDIPNKTFKGIDEKNIQSLLARRFVETRAGVRTAINAFLINTGKNLVLIDTGAADCFNSDMGHLADNLRASGYKPEQVDTVLLTHLHPEHACGLTRNGKMAFPNAAVYVSHYESDYWLDEENAKQVSDANLAFFKKAQDAVAPYVAAGKFKTFGLDETLVPDVGIVSTPGHTPGHTSYLFTSGDQRLLVWGDIVHSHAIQFVYPDVTLEYDMDAKQSIAARKKVFGSVTKENLWVAGAHLPFPGLGHMSYDGERYRWIAVEYGPVRLIGH